jgi:arylsulfatase A-like enzyme
MASAHTSAVTPARRITLGFLAGLLGGTIVGIVESFVVLSGNVDLPEIGIFPYAVIWYGILSALFGMGLGIAGCLVPRALKRERPEGRIFSFTMTAVIVIEGVIIGRFRIVRDMFHEKYPGPALDLVLLVGAVVLFFILHRGVFTPLLSRTGLSRLARAGTSVPLYAIVLLLSFVASFLYGAFTVRKPGTQSAEELAKLEGKPNILLVIVDTLRADRLSAYGYAKETSPNVDRLAADGIRFTHGFAQASWTRPSIATVFTSLYPSSHRAIGKADQLPDEVVTIAEAMKLAGYYTVGFADNINIADVFNFDQGFDEYHYLAPDYFFYAPESATNLTLYNQQRLVRERFLSKKKWVQFYYQDAVVVTDHVVDWLEKNKGKKFFLAVHYMDPHDPYFVHPYTGEGYARVSMPNPDPALAGKFSDLYDGEIEFFDAEFGRLLGWFEEHGLYDETVMLLTADHGEEFYEHEGWWHGTTLYDEQIHIPLIIKPEGWRKRGVVMTGLARNLDIPPTLLSLAGARIPPSMQGTPLIDTTGSVSLALEYVFSEEDFEGNVLQAVREPHRKLVLANKGNPRGLAEREFFDLAADPGELKNLAGSQQELESELAARIATTEKLALESAVGAQKGEIDQATQERLKALGYVE